MLGAAAVAMWWDIAPEVQPEWEDWHTNEHMPERLSIPGFLCGSRWVCGASYFVLYELDRPETLTGPAYMERLNSPTPWSRRMMPHHRNMVRSLCEVREGFGRGLAGMLATMQERVDVGALRERKGICAAHLLQARPLANVAQTAEQKMRGGDREAKWVALVGGYDAEAVAQALPGGSLYRLSYCL